MMTNNQLLLFEPYNCSSEFNCTTDWTSFDLDLWKCQLNCSVNHDINQCLSLRCSNCVETQCRSLCTCVTPQFEHLFLFLFLILFCLATILGNLLVVLAVLRERSLHTVTNYFITSLAVADGLVGLVVMPFSATYEAMGQHWIFGPDWCDFWHSLDVLASTASILNLCVISLDRYWAVKDPLNYQFKMTHRK